MPFEKRGRPVELSELTTKIRGMARAADEFAGEVAPEACEAAIGLIGLVSSRHPSLPLPRVGPAIDGGVSMHWQHGEWGVVASTTGDPDCFRLNVEGPRFFQKDGTCTANQAAILLGEIMSPKGD